jgi:hypothetical protein
MLVLSYVYSFYSFSAGSEISKELDALFFVAKFEIACKHVAIQDIFYRFSCCFYAK